MIEVENFSTPNEVKLFGKGKVELVKIEDAAIGKLTYKPGWKWSTHVKPMAKTDLCMMTHYIYLESGVLHVKMDDGSEMDLKKDSIALIPPGHDAWVVGNETVVGIDFAGAVEAASMRPTHTAAITAQGLVEEKG